MATLNEVKYQKLSDLIGKPGTLNELEHLYLDALGATSPAHLNEKWYEIFGETSGAWNENAHKWLTTQGVPEKGTLNERWYLFWIS
jgi:hypothetical protein